MAKKTSAPDPTPSHLKAAGRRFFVDMTRDFVFDDAGSIGLLTRAAECVDGLEDANATIEKFGAVIELEDGRLVSNPAVKIAKEARDGFYAALRLLKLETEQPRGPGRPARGFGILSEDLQWLDEASAHWRADVSRKRLLTHIVAVTFTACTVPLACGLGRRPRCRST